MHICVLPLHRKFNKKTGLKGNATTQEQQNRT
jgi:hypothetical protein